MTTKSNTTMPKVDVDAMVSLHKSNLDTFVAAQRIFFDLAQTMAKRQSDMMQDVFVRTETMMKSSVSRTK